MVIKLSLQPCDILIFRGTNDVLDYAIQGITRSKYDHVAGAIKGDLIIEARNKVTYYDVKNEDDPYDVYRYDGLTLEQQQRILTYVKSQVGKQYSYLLLFLQFFRYVFGFNIPNMGKKIICSTLWVEAYRSVGIDLCPGIRYPSPADVANSRLIRKIN